MTKNISLVAGSAETLRVIKRQLSEYIQESEIAVFSIEEGVNEMISADLVILSSDLVYEELLEMDRLDRDSEMIIAKRSINYDHLDAIVSIKEGTKVLLVNDMRETAEEVIENLKKIGIDHLHYIPYYPGAQVDKSITVAITPGEREKAPGTIVDLFDIGPRILDFTTIAQILTKLGLLDEHSDRFSQKYLEKIILIAKRLASSKNEVLTLNKQLEDILDGLGDALVVFKSSGKLVYFNENMKKVFGIKDKDFRIKNLKDLIKDEQLYRYLLNEKEDLNKIFELDSGKVVVKKMPQKDDTTLVTFKGESQAINDSKLLRETYIKKGLYAKYGIEDIIHKSSSMNRVKEITQKLSQSELTILIEGESGTGKEMIASAIHNLSMRKEGPFLAVNFSSLPDELIESELFGYEEGAFTGAKKGGKIGLFEQANGGTIFMDEVGDISIKLQKRLLRVLQENEIIRVGGNEIITVDVRVVAATNCDLFQMVKRSQFREDLYYRLKMGYIAIPPLRERKEDILPLAEFFLRSLRSNEVEMSDAVVDRLVQYEWLGNVRELKNTMVYMMAVCDGKELKVSDLPSTSFFQEHGVVATTDENQYLLQIIKEFNDKNDLCGREKIAVRTMGTKYEMTKYQIRTKLEQFESEGLITLGRGKIGARLTEEGKKLLNGHANH